MKVKFFKVKWMKLFLITLIRLNAAQLEIDSELIKTFIKSLKNNKKAGKNGVVNEMLKCCKETQVPNILANLFESLLNGCHCPDNINIGIIIMIIKDPEGCNTSFDNSRPITISEPIAMILESLIINDFSKKGKLSKHQYGFKAQSSCSHAVFALKEIASHARRNSINAIALFLDFSKAFDKVNRSKLWFRLMKVLSPKYWLLLVNYYEQLKLHVIGAQGEMSESFSSSVGVKQGGKFSPTLFNCIIDELIIRAIDSKLTYNIGQESVGVLVYADDTTIICKSLKDMKILIKIIESFCGDYDISINAKKTKLMRLTPNYSIEDGYVQMGGQIIEEVKHFKFLGVIISSNGKIDEHFNKRKKLFFNGLAEIKKLGFSKPDVNTKIKALLYVSLVRSKLVYGFECTDLKDLDKLCALEVVK
jgi:hypothetical protein